MHKRHKHAAVTLPDTQAVRGGQRRPAAAAAAARGGSSSSSSKGRRRQQQQQGAAAAAAAAAAAGVIMTQGVAKGDWKMLDFCKHDIGSHSEVVLLWGLGEGCENLR
jgi:hypothetical protein